MITARRQWRRRRALVIALAAVGVVAALGTREALAIRSNLVRVKATLAPAAAAASDLDIGALRAAVQAAIAPAHSAAAAARSPVLRAVSGIPVAGRSVRALRSLAAAAADAVGAADVLLDALGGFPSSDGKLDYAIEDGRIDLRPWLRAAPHAERAAQRIERAQAALAAAPATFTLPAVSSARREAVAQIDTLAGAVRAFRDGSRLLPSMLGADGPRRYLVVLQNLSESRATGGIPAGTVVFETRAGRFRLRDVATNLEIVTASRDIPAAAWFRRRYDHFAARRLWVNANVEADFRVTGGSMSALFREITGQRLDGLFAIDPLALREILTVTGPITGPGGRRVAADNVAKLILSDEYTLFPSRHDHVKRKAFFEGLALVIWERLAASSDLDATAEALSRAARGKHILLWSAHPDEQAVFERAGLAGAVGQTEPGPGLAFITQSGSGNKMDYYLRREIDLDLRPRTDGQVDARMRVRLRNIGPSSGLPAYVLGADPSVPSYAPGFIRIYFSFYLPPTASVIDLRSGQDALVYESEIAPHAVIISDFITVLPGREVEVTLDLRIRRGSGEVLDLMLQKQPTVVPDQVTVSLAPVLGGSSEPLFAGAADGDIAVSVPSDGGLLRRLGRLLAR